MKPSGSVGLKAGMGIGRRKREWAGLGIGVQVMYR